MRLIGIFLLVVLVAAVQGRPSENKGTATTTKPTTPHDDKSGKPGAKEVEQTEPLGRQERAEPTTTTTKKPDKDEDKSQAHKPEDKHDKSKSQGRSKREDPTTTTTKKPDKD